MSAVETQIKPYYETQKFTLFCGDCRSVLPTFDDCSVDSIVCDPPYELGFMSKRWDRSGIAYDVEVWRECLRVLKPGGHLLAFGGSRTYHRLACAIEDAGFEIRDQIQWIYGSGFPKSLDVSKAIDATGKRFEFFDEVRNLLNGALTRSGLSLKAINEMMGYATNGSGMAGHWFANVTQQTLPTKEQWFRLKDILAFDDRLDDVFRNVINPNERPIIGFHPQPARSIYSDKDLSKSVPLTAPSTDAAKQWNGWGTALKPAQEILTVAYKPHEYEGERGKIDANLSLLEARLWSLLPARIAVESFQLSRSEYDAACGSAQWTADERSSIQAALLDPMDTSRCVSVMSTCLSIVRSWRNTLDALCEVTNTSTIETKTSLITDLRILSYLLSQTTPSIIIKAASQADGQALNALPVAQHFAAARLKLNGILTLSALDAATSKAHTLHRAATESNGIVLARKPLIGNVAKNVLKHGTGGLNIDGCRVETADIVENGRGGRSAQDTGIYGRIEGQRESEWASLGRWPANVILDGSGEVLAGFPDARSAGDYPSESIGSGNGHTFLAQKPQGQLYSDSGSAARFFYVPKASQEDRNEGCEDLPHRVADEVHKRPRTELDDPRRHGVTPRQNNHPTVKPTELMRYLCRLITPPGGVVLDPFCGSGSTGKAAMLEGLRFIGIELSNDYCQLAQRRIEAVTKQGSLFA